MFLSRRRDLGKYAKNYGERVTFNSFTTDPGVPKKNVIVPPFQNVDLLFSLLRPLFTLFAHISRSPSNNTFPLGVPPPAPVLP